MYPSSGNCKTQRHLTDSNIWHANGSDVRRRPQNLTTQLSPVLGFIARIGERTGLTCFTFLLDLVLRYSALRAIETYHTSIELIGRFPQSTSLAKINRWMLKLAVWGSVICRSKVCPKHKRCHDREKKCKYNSNRTAIASLPRSGSVVGHSTPEYQSGYGRSAGYILRSDC